MNLFCPGPVNVSNAIFKSDLKEISHRGVPFQKIFSECSLLTKTLFNCGDEYTPLFLTGSGTLSVESVIFSYLKHKKTLLVQNGFFSEKWEGILKTHGCLYGTINFGWGNEYSLPAIREALKTNNYDCIFLIHHETSTTMINDIEKINSLCKDYGIGCVVDGVSSIGLYRIDLTELSNIFFVCYSTNKAIGSFPGLSVVIGKTKNLQQMTDDLTYLNLKQYYTHALLNETPFTPCVQNFYYYRNALLQIINDTDKIERYEELSKYTIERFKDIGMSSVLTSGKQCCWVINFLCENPSILYYSLMSKNIVVYKCKGLLENKAIQIGIFNKNKCDIDNLIDIVQSCS
jgi:2-aminoethylphosphonate-pyruvate transaminase